MVLEKQVGPEILLWPFLGNKICHEPDTKVPVPTLVPSDSPFPTPAPLPLLSFA